MAAMQAAGPKIESSGDTLRIEFPAISRRAVILAFTLAFLVLGYLVGMMFPDSRVSDRVLMGLTSLYLGLRLTWDNARRYTILLSERGLAVRQQAFGFRWTKFYPLGEIQNLHLGHNPVRAKSPKQWELMFDRYGLAQEVPIPMTVPDGQSVKAAIYSRFPQLDPAKPALQEA